jgi:hypothetical protein
VTRWPTTTGRTPSRRTADHFVSGELAFNENGRIGWFSRLAIKLYPQNKSGAR